MSRSLLEARRLNKVFRGHRGFLGGRSVDHHAVKDVDLVAGDGETVVIIGESGAGKSTAGRLVTRLIEPDAGSVFLMGTEVTALSQRELQRFRVHMQMVFQDPHSSLNPRVRILDSVAEPLLVHTDLRTEERRRQAGELLERVGIPPASFRSRPRELSGGQLQRVAIARALSVNPRLIVCDEPVSALDVSIRAQVLNLMLDLKRDFNITYLFITHDLTLVPVLADHVVVMSKGEVVETGSPDAILNNPTHDYTRRLVQAMPSLVPKSRRTPVPDAFVPANGRP